MNDELPIEIIKNYFYNNYNLTGFNAGSEDALYNLFFKHALCTRIAHKPPNICAKT